MTSGGFQLDGQVISANSTGAFQLCSDDLVLFSGTNDQLTFMRGGANTIVAYGKDQTIESGLCVSNAIYLLGRDTNLEFYESVSGTTMVYGGQSDGAFVTLLYGQTATETAYRAGFQWGEQVTIRNASNASVISVADFAYDPHVAIVPAAT
jgi:hypothetical protein